MTYQINALWMVGGAGFALASLFSFRSYLLTRRTSSTYVWISISLMGIAISRFLQPFYASDSIFKDIFYGLMIIAGTLLLVAVFDFDKSAKLCVKCGSAMFGVPEKEKLDKAKV